MTYLETHRPPFVPTGRPVRRFVAGLVVLAVLFGALWLSDPVAPRLGTGVARRVRDHRICAQP